MLLSSNHSSSALSRQKAQLLEQAKRDQARSEALKAEGTEALERSTEHRDAALETGDVGRELQGESNRLRRNGREQSLRGLDRLEQADQKYAQSEDGFREGLDGLERSIEGMAQARQTSDSGLQKIDRGLARNESVLRKQERQADRLEQTESQASSVRADRGERLEGVGERLPEQSSSLDQQGGLVGEFLMAGADFESGSAVKREGFSELRSGAESRVKGEEAKDSADTAHLRETFHSADAERHKKSESRLLFDGLWQKLKAVGESRAAVVQQGLAEQSGQSAEALQARSQTLDTHAAQQSGQARTLEGAGRNHVAIGRQLQMCPWTYCQGVALERQGQFELDQAQQLKQRATATRNEAQQLAIQAEKARVRAEQATERAREHEVSGAGAQTRSEILLDRSDEHGTRGTEADRSAREAGVDKGQADRRAQQWTARAEAQEVSGITGFFDGSVIQADALNAQGELHGALDAEFARESRLGAENLEDAQAIREGLGQSGTLLSKSRSLYHELRSGQNSGRKAEEKIRAGIDELGEGVSAGREAQSSAEQARALLEEARELELEGLRLQNRGQRMLLESRPKMADARRLSGEAFQAFQQADDHSQTAQTLLIQGEEKLAAAAILKDKAAAYRALGSAN